MAKIRKPEYKQKYLEFIDEAKDKEAKNIMLMIEERGMAKGMAQGISIGEQRGISLGRSEGISIAKLETARKFLAMGLPIEQVADGTGLTIARVKKLAKLAK